MKREGLESWVLVIFLVMAGSFMTIIGTVPSRVSATTLYVGGTGPGNYTTIQEAVTAATAGDKVVVLEGTYNEDVYISKELRLIGQGWDRTTINGTGTGSVIRIVVSHVTVEGFLVMNSGPGGPAGRDSGIEVRETDYATILNNSVTSSNHGILAWRSIGTVISNNTVWNNSRGISLGWLGSQFGAYSTEVSNNTILNNYQDGIKVRDSGQNTILCNVVKDNPTGIRLQGSDQNRIYHNDIISLPVDATDNGVNWWDNGYPSGGNFWAGLLVTDNFKGPNQDQLGSDGISDTNRSVPGGSNVDNYPLVMTYNLPSPPRNLQASSQGTQVSLVWDPPNSSGTSPITNYTVYRGVTSGPTTRIATLGTVLTYIDTNVAKGTTYNYRLGAVNRFGEGPFSLEATATPVTPPSAPTNLTATFGDQMVSLSWDAPTDTGGLPITNYTVYRGTAPGNRTLIATLGNVLTYIDTNLTNGLTYFYTVVAINAINHGPNSSEVSSTPSSKPGAPLNLKVTVGDGQLTLTWSVPANDGGFPITNYTVYRGTIPGGETLLTALGNVLSYIDTDVVNGQTYYYKVTARNSIGEGPKSPEASATPAPPTIEKSILEETWFWALIIVVIIAIITILAFVTRGRKGKVQNIEEPPQSEEKS